MRRCTTCGKLKSRSDFYPRRRENPDNLRTECKPCQQIRRRAYEKKSRKRINAQKVAWSKRNPEKDREKNRKAYAKRKARRQLDPEFAASERERWRRAKAKRMKELRESDPEGLERLRARARESNKRIRARPGYLEKRRIYETLRRRQNGAKEMLSRRVFDALAKERDISLPAEPFRQFLRIRESEYPSRDDMARALGIDERIVYRLLVKQREGGQVFLSTVDKALTNDGAVSLSTLYPEDVAA